MFAFPSTHHPLPYTCSFAHDLEVTSLQAAIGFVPHLSNLHSCMLCIDITDQSVLSTPFSVPVLPDSLLLLQPILGQTPDSCK